MWRHKVLAPPPTAQTHQPIFLLGTALDTLGHTNGAIVAIFEFQLLTPQFCDFLAFRGWIRSGQKVVILGGLKVETQNHHGGAICIAPRYPEQFQVKKLVDGFEL